MSDYHGRRIYRNKISSRKKRRKTGFYVFLSVIALSVLVFVGYSIANPIFNFFKNRNNEEDIVTDPWVPPVTTEYVGTEKKDTIITEKNKSDETSIKTTDNRNLIDYSAYSLPVTALSDSATLKDKLVEIKNNGYNAVVVTLKDKGGAFYYDTKSDMALSAEGAIKGKMSADQISSIISAAGLKPIASINILEDNNRYGEKRKGSYRFLNDNSTWLDNSVAKGGKPWLSPFDIDTQNLMSYIANEISSAGFNTIICDGLVFPPFRNNDFNYIGSIIQNENRYQALINIAKIIKNTAESNESNIIIQISAADIINGNSEIFKPDLLVGSDILVYYSSIDFGKTIVIDNQEIVLTDMNAFDKTTLIFKEIKKIAGENIKIIPYISNNNMNQSDYNDTLTALIELEFDSYIIK